LLDRRGRLRRLRRRTIGPLEALRDLLAFRILLLELEEDRARLLQEPLVDVEIDLPELLGIRVAVARPDARRGPARGRSGGLVFDLDRDLVSQIAEREPTCQILRSLLLDLLGNRPGRRPG